MIASRSSNGPVVRRVRAPGRQEAVHESSPRGPGPETRRQGEPAVRLLKNTIVHRLVRGCVLAAWALWGVSGWAGGGVADGAAGPTFPDRPIAYVNHVIEEEPWSIHIVRLARGHAGLALSTTLGGGEVLGMATVTEQMQRLPADLGRPLAALNGDFYFNTDRYPGRPRDLQVYRGEVVSAPAGHSCFWLDAQGNPHMTNVASRFRVVWPDGRETPIGLNSRRDDLSIVLYTAVAGASTRTTGGLELEVVDAATGEWPPLGLGEARRVRVRSVFPQGDTPLQPTKAVLSVGPGVSATLPALEAGTSVLTVITETVPALHRVGTAMGGGPALVRNGQPMEWNGLVHFRHPRSAVGWDDAYFYLVQIDGRQGGVSVGMTLRELAEYLVRLGCKEALNLDGGGSSTLWAFGNVVNSPSEGRERPGANALVIVKQGAVE